MLSDRERPRRERCEALKFLVHLVTDAHQPLHTAARDGDQGGIALSVTFFGEPTNLHAVWDFGLLDRAPTIGASTVRRIEETWPGGQSLTAGG